MAREIRHSLVISRVVGDVLDPFTPTVELRLLYDGRVVFNGSSLRPSHVVCRPRVEIGGDDFQAFYTLVMVDADAPNPSNPHLKEYLHWLVTDIPIGSTISSTGTEIVSYESPQPTLGIHRLVLVLFRQSGRQTVDAPRCRQNFNTREFSQEYRLGSPVAAVYYTCQRENGTGGRRATQA